MISCHVLLIGLVLLLETSMAGEFYYDSPIRIELDPHTKSMAKKDLRYSPIRLDASNGEDKLFPSRIITFMQNPRFKGLLPPGVASFILTQMLLSGFNRKKMVYPLFSKEAVRLFFTEGPIINSCSSGKSSASCKNGYKKVTVKNSSCTNGLLKGSQRTTTTTTTSGSTTVERQPETKSTTTTTSTTEPTEEASGTKTAATTTATQAA